MKCVRYNAAGITFQRCISRFRAAPSKPGPDDARSRPHSPREEPRPMGGASMSQSRFCRDQISW